MSYDFDEALFWLSQKTGIEDLKIFKAAMMNIVSQIDITHGMVGGVKVPVTGMDAAGLT